MHPSNLAEVIEKMGLDKKWEKRGKEIGEEKGVEKGINMTVYVVKRLKENATPESIASELNLPTEQVDKIIRLLQ